MSEPVEVLQCDREAAQALMLEIYGDRLVGDKARREEVTAGVHDDIAFVQAFARHRIAAHPGTRELREALEAGEHIATIRGESKP